MFATGERLRFDGGDAFVVSPLGQEPETSLRVTTGELIGRSPTAVFVDECDAVGTCGYFVIDIASGERTPVSATGWEQINDGLNMTSMSPDGATMLVSGPLPDTSFFFELATGVARALPVRLGSTFGRTVSAWAPDSSGIFTVVDGEIVFVDRIDGASTSVPVELPENSAVVDVDARPAPPR